MNFNDIEQGDIGQAAKMYIRINKKILFVKTLLLRYNRNIYFKTYFFISIVLLLLFICRHFIIIPYDVLQITNKKSILKVTDNFKKPYYEMLFMKHSDIMQSSKLLNKYSNMESEKMQFEPEPYNQKNLINNLKKICRHLFEEMKTHNYLCLSAIHVGLPKQITAIADTCIINPEIINYTGQQVEGYETTAFYPEIELKVARNTNVTVGYYDDNLNYHPKNILLETSARCILHHVDLYHNNYRMNKEL